MRIVTPSRRGICALFIGSILFASVPNRAEACYTGLALIPTAETMQAGSYGIELQLDGGFPCKAADTHILNTQIGLTSRLEAGLDFDLSVGAASRMLLNAKYRILSADGQRFDAAVGICNVGRHLRSLPYAVATYASKGFRVHLGEALAEKGNEWFVGMDKPVGERLTLMADYLRGAENSASLGISYQLDERLGILAAAMFPNDRTQETRFTLHVVLSGPIRFVEKCW